MLSKLKNMLVNVSFLSFSAGFVFCAVLAFVFFDTQPSEQEGVKTKFSEPNHSYFMASCFESVQNLEFCSCVEETLAPSEDALYAHSAASASEMVLEASKKCQEKFPTQKL